VQEQISMLDRNIHDTITRDGNVMEDIPQELQDEDYEVYDPMEPDADKPEANAYTPEMYDSLINAEVLLPKGDILLPARVTGRKRDGFGNPIGIANSNPILDSRVYNVEFPDGHTESYSANIIAENIYAQVDEEGKRLLLLGEILNHQNDGSAKKADDKYIMQGANKTLRCTTQGWYFQVQ
jgi:hypothetical protein